MLSKYSEFKPTGVSIPTPLSMMQSHPDQSAYPDAHKYSSGGVVPGYQGHVPRARDTFGSTATGGLAPDIHVGAHKKMGCMTGHESQGYGQKHSAGPLGAGPLRLSQLTTVTASEANVLSN